MSLTSRAVTVMRSNRSAFAVLTLLCCCGMRCGTHSDQPAAVPQKLDAGETIVLIRHGEKPVDGLGQLTCLGWNRALALPKVLLTRFGTPAAIFAPNPGDEVNDDGQFYSYVRPLATIEPTAVQLGLPVKAQLSYHDIASLQADVTEAPYANSTVFIAWEHEEAVRFAQQMLRSFGQDPSAVPPWSDDDYETVYVFHITVPREQMSTRKVLYFRMEKEGLEGSLSSTCAKVPM